ncbi:MAG: amidohydrolase [Bacteroidia bacterium]|nr:amidohydrolase [Bacteroidia bacterium]
MPLSTTIQQHANSLAPYLLGVRRHLHKYPELSFIEHNTSAYIQEQLTTHNIEFTAGIAGTGIVAIIKGNNPNSKCVALRADIDALPIQELNTAPYTSVNAGIMHACGHDVHTTCTLGAAIILNTLKDKLEGSVKILFQPGEEKLPGGASLMINEGVLHNPSVASIIGQHVQNSIPVGKVGFCKGMYMASTDELYITLTSKGGHGAMPHLTTDVVVVAAQLILALQTITSRNANPIVPTVLSIGKMQALGATNVLPTQVVMEGTFRTFDETWRTQAHTRIHQIVNGIAHSMNCEADVRIEKGYPFLINDAMLTEACITKAKQYLGEDNVLPQDMRMTAEDFAYYSQHVPACFYRLGTGNASKGISANVHTPNFDIDEDALAIGAGLMAYMCIE